MAQTPRPNRTLPNGYQLCNTDWMEPGVPRILAEEIYDAALHGAGLDLATHIDPATRAKHIEHRIAEYIASLAHPGAVPTGGEPPTVSTSPGPDVHPCASSILGPDGVCRFDPPCPDGCEPDPMHTEDYYNGDEAPAVSVDPMPSRICKTDADRLEAELNAIAAVLSDAITPDPHIEDDDTVSLRITIRAAVVILDLLNDRVVP